MSDKIKNIPLKFSRQAVIPLDLIVGDDVGQRYKLVNGEIVTFAFYKLTIGPDSTDFKEYAKRCQEWYKMDFNTFKAVWQRRLGAIPQGWAMVEMRLVE